VAFSVSSISSTKRTGWSTGMHVLGNRWLMRFLKELPWLIPPYRPSCGYTKSTAFEPWLVMQKPRLTPIG